MDALIWFMFGVQALVIILFGCILAYGVKQLRHVSTSAFEHLKARSLEDLSEFHRAETEAQVQLQNIYDYEAETPPPPQTVLTADGRRIPIDEIEMLG